MIKNLGLGEVRLTQRLHGPGLWRAHVHVPRGVGPQIVKEMDLGPQSREPQKYSRNMIGLTAETGEGVRESLALPKVRLVGNMAS